MFQSHKNTDDEELDLSGLIQQDTSAEPPPQRDPNTPGRATRAAQRAKNTDKSKEKRAAPSANPMQTRSAASRRAEREARRRSITGESEPRPAKRSASQLEQSRVAELLSNPTREVTEAELKHDYSYVLADLRSMGLLSVALVALLIILAQVLPR